MYILQFTKSLYQQINFIPPCILIDCTKFVLIPLLSIPYVWQRRSAMAYGQYDEAIIGFCLTIRQIKWYKKWKWRIGYMNVYMRSPNFIRFVWRPVLYWISRGVDWGAYLLRFQIDRVCFFVFFLYLLALRLLWRRRTPKDVLQSYLIRYYNTRNLHGSSVRTQSIIMLFRILV